MNSTGTTRETEAAPLCPPPDVPDGYRVRPLSYDDAQVVTDLIAAGELVDVGKVEIVLEDVEGDWARPSYEPARDGVLVLDSAGDAVAVAEVSKGSRADVAVHPAHRGRGIGSALLAWTFAQARAAGGTTVGQTVLDAKTDARELFESAGMHQRYTSWILEIDVTADHPAPHLPEGVVIRAASTGEDERRAAWQVIEDSFAHWPGRTAGTYADWAAAITGRKGFEPWQLAVAVDGDEVVGTEVLLVYPGSGGWVQQIAVRADHRGRGIGAALLDHAFGTFAARGETVVGLNTDSRTGALGLYEKVGMAVVRSYTNWALDL